MGSINFLLLKKLLINFRLSIDCMFFLFYFIAKILLLDFAGANLTKWAIEYEEHVAEASKLSMVLKLLSALGMV